MILWKGEGYAVQMGLHLRKDGSIDTSNFKIVYVAPMKALVAEMVGNFSTRLEPYGVKVRELTGDMNLTKAEIEETQVKPLSNFQQRSSLFSLASGRPERCDAPGISEALE